jgi:hypothetical protein
MAALLLLPHAHTNVVLNTAASPQGGSKLVLVGGPGAGDDGRKFVTSDAFLFAALLREHAGM